MVFRPISIALICACTYAAASPPVATFTENKGQWPDQVLYRARIPGGALFVERSAFTFVLYDGVPMHRHGVESEGTAETPLRAHAYRMHFVEGRATAVEGAEKQPQYENYFQGDDPAQWGGGCRVFGEVMLRDVWPGIDIRLDGSAGIKYELVLAPGADPDRVRMRYVGQSGLELRDGALIVSLVNGSVVESPPISFLNGEVPVNSNYVLNGDEISYRLGPGYRPDTDALVIDPTLAFASYSGSTADNFGYTATFDEAGHLYGGGIVFQAGYPVTTGVLQGMYTGGTIDVGISKWTPDGSGLVWSTYLGGSGAESPHSLVVNAAEELFVMGSTGSANFPVTPGAYDISFNTGLPITWTNISGGYGFNHNNGTDIYVAHFNAAATALIGSTYIGGTGQDGLNNSSLSAHNYGDHFRGEIALDPSGSPVVATTTFSTDMPVTPGAPQPSNGGLMDGYCFRMDPALTTLLWGTYLGGSGTDNGLGLQFDSNGEIFVSGGTTSADLPMAGSPFDASFNGVVDGYLYHYSADGLTLLSSTYIGTSEYDQAYFVQLNTADEVFAVGQTRGAFPITPGKYANPGSSQFVQKFDHALSSSLWSTRLGNGNPSQDLSPTAFLVSDCDQIYLSGWAGNTNANAGNFNSSTTGSPVTADAFQSTTTGSDFYLMVLEAEAIGLNYATFFGGPSSAEHVDGGTSRFDKNGTVYQAVCAGCGSQDDFPTSPGAWSNVNGSFNCNLGVFKFNLGQPQAIISIDGPSTICTGSTAQFVNNSVGGNSYVWDFGDQSDPSTEQEPSHTFTDPGTFTVTMILSDTLGCGDPDTTSIDITVVPPPTAVADPVAPFCPGEDAQLQASGGTTYLWSPAMGLNATNIADPILTTSLAGQWTVVVGDQCGTDTAVVDIVLFGVDAFAGPDTTVCQGLPVELSAAGGVQYEWAPAGSLSDAFVPDPIATPDTTTTYTVTITTTENCVILDSLTVNVFFELPEQALIDTTICAGDTVSLSTGMALTYAWQDQPGIAPLDVRTPQFFPSVPTLFIVAMENSCGIVLDSVFIDVITVVASAWPDTLICPGIPVQLGASGGTTYAWSPAEGLNDPSLANPQATPSISTTYIVDVSDDLGCSDTAQVTVQLRSPPTVEAGPDVIIDYGDATILNASGSAPLTWSPTDLLNDPLSESPLVSPEESTAFMVTATDPDGCIATDILNVIVTGSLYVPNTFSPNGDGVNDSFGATGKDIATAQLLVFNRWGELIWSTDKLSGRWDGTYKGVASPIDTYVWKLEATELSGRKRDAIGHVNLIR